MHPFEASGTPAPPAPPSLSRVADFMTCPLRYRFRAIDRLPERPSAAATRDTLVHAVLERLFDDPAMERTAARARSLVAGEWERLPAAAGRAVRLVLPSGAVRGLGRSPRRPAPWPRSPTRPRSTVSARPPRSLEHGGQWRWAAMWRG